MFIQILLLIAGFLMLIKGADWFVEGAVGIADRFNIPPVIIGLTIVAMGTSAPEAAVSITSAFQGAADITVGNIVGSNIINILVILGLAAAIVPLAVTKTAVKDDLPFLVGITVLFLLMGINGVISLADGIVLVAFFVLYNIYLIRRTIKYPENTDGSHTSTAGVSKSVLMLITGMALIILGSNTAVNAATEIARLVGISERIIGLTVVALGTSLPELVTSVTAALKGNADIAVGNIVGSNIFNILFVVGISSLIVPVPFSRAFMPDMIISLVATVFIYAVCRKNHSLPRWSGFVMLAGYVGYMFYLL